MTKSEPQTMTDGSVQAISVQHLNFDFGGPPILVDVTLELPKGARCLLVGANGAGKSTLLRVLAGKNLTRGDVKVLGRRAFDEGSVGVTYLGTEWAHNPIVRRDVPVARLLKSLGAERHRERCEELLNIMDVNPNWHMHEVSDGQRRRVQIVLGLMEPWDVLLLDEVTVDLDVVVRKDLLRFLRKETEERGATIMYATHIFDGLGEWGPTHVAHMAGGRIAGVHDFAKGFAEMDAAVAECEQRMHSGSGQPLMMNSPLLLVVERWLRKDDAKREGRMASRWDELAENMKEYGDKYYNYWRN